MDPHLPSNDERAFERAYPTGATAASIHDEQELHRAVVAYRFFYPTVSAEAIFNGGRELGIEDGKQLMVLAATPHHVVFTANSDTPYASGCLDLQSMGPVVIDLPAGPYIGLIDDHHQGWVLDMGIPGPDQGAGGKYLVLPPDHEGDVPDGYHVAQAPTYKVLLALRALPQKGDVGGALAALRKVRVHPLSNPAGVLPFVDVSSRAMDSTPLRWERGLEFWQRLHSVIDLEPALPELRALYGELAALGIEKGVPFAPAKRLRQILETAAVQGADEMRVEAFASQRPDRLVWPDRQWEWAGLVPDDPSFETKGFLDLEARERWFFQAIVTSPAMFRRKAGVGSIYFLAARDGSGAYLDGGSSYKLTVPQPVPAMLFWSLTAYDARTRSQVQTAQKKAVLTSLLNQFERGPDGAIELYLGPRPPAGKEKQWIQTAPDTGVFLYFRIYGPEASGLDGSWRLGDLTRIDAGEGKAPAPSQVSAEALRACSTPETVESKLGLLQFPAGVPTAETASAVYDNLDQLHGTACFLDGLAGVSTYAIRKGFLDVGVKDNQVLLFSGLMDCRSLFLTANCDTVYFFSFLDLGQGPLVLEVPPRVLGVIDDMWFQFVTDVGLPGPDRGEGGRYLLVPHDYQGPLPEGGYHVARVATHHALLLGRAFLEEDDPAPAVARIRRGLKIHHYVPGGVGSSIASFLRGKGPLVMGSAPPPSTRMVEGTGLAINTLPPNDHSFFEMLNAVVQLEPAEALSPEVAGHFAAIGIVKDKPFAPDARLKKILTEAVAIANATARTLTFTPRDAEGFRYYDNRSAWLNPLFPGGYDFLRPPPTLTKEGVKQFPDRNARLLNSRSSFFYVATGITPAMCMRLTDVGSQYLGAFVDARGTAFDGSKAYQVKLPPNIPAAAFWSLTLYDNQTRSMLQTSQRFPRAGSQGYPTPAARPNRDGSFTIHFGPQAPADVDAGNFIETVPGKGWFMILRLYSPLAPFFDKSWRPEEIEPMR